MAHPWALDSLDFLSREQLLQVILDQHRMIEQLRAEIEKLKRKGGAARFPKARANPIQNGRDVNRSRLFQFRNAPEEALGTEAIEVPEQPRLEVQRYSVEVRGCWQCGRKTRSRRPDIAPGQHGATDGRAVDAGRRPKIFRPWFLKP
jgi:hypothetical protein